jgi:acyl-CoA hydrolase
MSDSPMGTLSMRHLVKYPECNATQNLFGGQMLAWVDEGAAMYAACQMKTDRLVTRKVGEIDFRVPVPLGYVCNIYARTKKEGNTSLTVTVTVTRRTFDGTGSEDVVCETDVVFVALDADGKPTPWTKTPPKKRRSKEGPPSVSPDQLNIFDANDPRADYLTHKRVLTKDKPVPVSPPPPRDA